MKTVIYNGPIASQLLNLESDAGVIEIVFRKGSPVEVPEDHPMIIGMIAEGHLLPLPEEPASKKPGKPE